MCSLLLEICIQIHSFLLIADLNGSHSLHSLIAILSLVLLLNSAFIVVFLKDNCLFYLFMYSLMHSYLWCIMANLILTQARAMHNGVRKKYITNLHLYIYICIKINIGMRIWAQIGVNLFKKYSVISAF